MIKSYYYLAKPGIIYGNAITALAGFFLASQGHVNFVLLLAMIFGISLVMGSACVFNNYIDQGIDKKMARTKKRALAAGTISNRNALIYGTILGLLGFSLLLFHVNALTAFIAFVGFFVYIVVYGIAKRRSVHGTIVGSIAGAVPPVVGYCAVTNNFDIGGMLLFLVLVLWQMPHFYAISIFRYDDYAAAGIPVLPIKKGIKTTKIQMLVYILAFLIATTLFTFEGLTGQLYLIFVFALGLWWLFMGIQGFTTQDDKRWARKMFGISLLVLTLLSIALSVDVFLPF